MTDESHPRMTLTIAQAAAELNVSRAQGYVLAGRGTLPTIRVGRRRRVIRTELERLLASGGLETTTT